MANKNINILMALKDRFSAPMRKINDLTKEQQKQLKKNTNALTKYGKDGAKALGKIAKVAGTALVTSLGAVGAFSVKLGVEFEASMSKVQAISGATGKDLEALTAKAKEMGATTAFSATDASQAMQYMAMAGWKTSDMLSGINGIMNLALASGEDLTMVSDIVTDALTAFGLQAKDSGRFADVLASASSNSNTNVALMGETFKYVAPLAGSLKYSVEDVAVAIGLMANSGIKGSQAGTALRSTMTRLIKPPKEASVALEKLGITVKNADGTVKPFSQTMLDLREKFKSLSDSEKAQMASSIAGQEAMSGFLAIVNASDADFDKLSKSINNSAGASEQMANSMQNNLQGQLNAFKSGLEGIGLNIYASFKKPLTDAFLSVNGSLGELNKSFEDGKLKDSFAKMGESLGVIVKALADGLIVALPIAIDMFNWIVDNGDVVASMLGAIGAGFAYFKVATIISGVVKALKGATGAMALFNAVMAMNPIVLVAIGVGALVGAIIMLWRNWDTVTKYVGIAWDKFKEFGSWLGEKFMGVIGAIADKIATIKDGFKAFGNKIFGGGGNEEHNALGTSYFKGGQTYVNEGNRGELINLPSGSQIVPHDIAKQATGGKNPITINLTVQGNVIGNEDFYNQCGNVISERVIMALGNI